MSYRECAEYVLEVSNNLRDMKKRYGYSNNDARGLMLSNCRGFCLYALSILNILSATEEGRLSTNNLRLLIGMKEGGNIQDMANILEKTVRLSFVTMYQFQQESLFRALLRELGVAEIPNGYYKVVETLLNELVILKANEKLEILNVPAKIRNSLHSHGIYGRPSTSVEIESVRYEFEHGRSIKTAGWEHICHALNAGLNILGEILDSPKIASVPTIASPTA